MSKYERGIIMSKKEAINYICEALDRDGIDLSNLAGSLEEFLELEFINN